MEPLKEEPSPGRRPQTRTARYLAAVAGGAGCSTRAGAGLAAAWRAALLFAPSEGSLEETQGIFIELATDQTPLKIYSTCGCLQTLSGGTAGTSSASFSSGVCLCASISPLVPPSLAIVHKLIGIPS